MLYIPILSSKAAQLSQAIFQLSRPPSIRDSNDVSTYYCAWKQHPTRPEVCSLAVPESDTIPIHVVSDGALLNSTLADFVPTELTQAEADGLAAAVLANAGQRVNVADLIPASWQPYVMTKKQAIAAGWIQAHKQP